LSIRTMTLRPDPSISVLRYYVRMSTDAPWHEVSRADYAALSAMAQGLPKLFEQASFTTTQGGVGAPGEPSADGKQGEARDLSAPAE